MTELLTAAQMRAAEQAAIKTGEVTGLDLMERAGRGVVAAIFGKWPDLAKTAHRAVVLCGPGNNGGDGFVVARLLADWGWEVGVHLYGNPEKLPPDAARNYRRWRALGAVRGPLVGDDDLRADLVVDALFGTGLARPLGGDYKSAVARMARCCAPEQLVAIDIRSGICADSGRDLSGCLEGAGRAGLTVAFHRYKTGHFLAVGAATSEALVCADIGLPQIQADPEKHVRLVGAPAHLCKRGNQHKYSHGHALILAGASGHGGAARLAARGCLRIGAGVVTLGCAPDAVVENAAQLNAIMLAPIHDADALARVLEDGRINALCLGPALGKDARARGLILTALAAKRATVLDADALSGRFFDEADALFDRLHENVVLTPHAGEFARMFPDIAAKLAATPAKGPAFSKVDACREAAAQAGCVVLLKGADTVIAAPDGRCAINSAVYGRAAPWLATAGAGDVLAGFIAGLLARGLPPMAAAETAAWLHVESARTFGPGLIAEDLPEVLPKVLAALAAPG